MFGAAVSTRTKVIYCGGLKQVSWRTLQPLARSNACWEYYDKNNRGELLRLFGFVDLQHALVPFAKLPFVTRWRC